MKKHGSVLEFADERDSEMLSALRRLLATSPASATIAQLCDQLVRQPASRFWVSQERACQVVSRLRRGLPALQGMRAPKQRMYLEIFRRVRALKAERPRATLTDLVSDVIYGEAPEHYMEPAHAYYLMARLLNKRARA